MQTYYTLGSQIMLPALASRIPSLPVDPTPPSVPELIDATETSVYDPVADKVVTMFNKIDPETIRLPFRVWLLTIPVPTSDVPSSAQAWIDSPNKRSSAIVLPGKPGSIWLSILEPLACGGQVILEFQKP